MLWKLINITDPCFAQYLGSNESDNCYFSFRWIICQFKREFMKAKTDDYDDCLVVWETIWSANALCQLAIQEEAAVHDLLLSEQAISHQEQVQEPARCEASGSAVKSREHDGSPNPSAGTSRSDKADKTEEWPVQNSSPKSSSTPVQKLKDMELFTLCICLSIIRRERDLIMANEYDACEILKVSGKLGERSSSFDGNCIWEYIYKLTLPFILHSSYRCHLLHLLQLHCCTSAL